MATAYDKWFNKYGAQYDVDPALLRSIARAESAFNPNAGSPAGAQGLMQFMPATFKSMGVGGNPYNPQQSIHAGAKYMSSLLRQFNGNTRLALAGYNAGGGAARKAITQYPETRNYVKRVMGYYGQRSGGGGGGGAMGQRRSTRTPARTLEYSYEVPSDHQVDAGLVNRLSMAAEILPSGADKAEEMIAGEYARATPRTVTKRLRIPGQSVQWMQPEYGTGYAMPGTGAVAKLPRRGNEPGWRYGQRLGRNLFGLQNDPGNSQTTGGRHTTGSHHYSGRAIDFGSARNSRQQLEAWYRFLNANRKRLGVVELLKEGWGTPNEHVHVAIQ